MRVGRLFLIFISLITVVYCKKFDSRCKLVRELMRTGLPNNSYLGQWVCLAEKVSNRDTSALHVTPSGKKYYGLFQIPKPWCKEGKRGGDCNVACESLLDDDITDDVACARNIFNQRGFNYWTQWTTRCKNDSFITNEIYKCPDLKSPRSSPERSVNLPETHRPRRKSYTTRRFGIPGIHWN